MTQIFHYNKVILMLKTEEKAMQDKLLRYTLRVDRVLFQKFRYIAEYEGRSANKEIEQYLKKRVLEFEREHGPIPPAPQDETKS